MVLKDLDVWIKFGVITGCYIDLLRPLVVAFRGTRRRRSLAAPERSEDRCPDPIPPARSGCRGSQGREIEQRRLQTVLLARAHEGWEERSPDPTPARPGSRGSRECEHESRQLVLVLSTRVAGLSRRSDRTR
jgi:hypothetical protein